MSRVIVGEVDVFDPRFDVRVIPVNCVGTMGKGLAKEADRRYPEAAAYYRRRCGGKEGALKPGQVAGYFEAPSVWFAATKDHWRYPSRGSWVLACAGGIAYLAAKSFLGGRVGTVAVPALGCGLGGLDWGVYDRAIEHALWSLGPASVTFYLSPPRGE